MLRRKQTQMDIFLNEDQFFFFQEKLRRDIDLIIFCIVKLTKFVLVHVN